MTARRDPRSQCAGKKTYKTKGQAKLAARRRGNYRIEAYRCPHCRFYHLGRKLPRRRLPPQEEN